MDYKTLVGLLLPLEVGWQKRLPLHNPDPRFANGEVQFFAVEKAAKTNPDDDLPVVLAIGINYMQNTKCQIWPTPCLRAHRSPMVTGTPSRMFGVLNNAFKAYLSDPLDWVNRSLASDVKIPVPHDYILIATNFSPIITFQSWQKYDPQYRANLLTLFSSGFDYLDELMLILKSNKMTPDVIVGHGLHSEVPSLFRKWQDKHSHRPWLLTSNLARPFPMGKNSFYQRPPPPVVVRRIGDSLNHEAELPEEPEMD
jgi:hypothetical protein